MNAFWWFKENLIAGMGRPGFNKVNWSQLTFEEDLILGWFGNRSSGTDTLVSLRLHLESHGKKLLNVHNVSHEKLNHILETMQSDVAIKKLIKQVCDKTDCLAEFDITEGKISFQMSKNRLHSEVEFLQGQEIARLVALTETHHQKDELETYFEVVHIPIADLGAPQFEQALELSQLIKDSILNKKRMVVHCMAGIGRTSTMLIAAHLILGDRFEDLKLLLAKQNPAFKFTDMQLDFLKTFSTPSNKF
jgi:protein-tyrosine phosphatase